MFGGSLLTDDVTIDNLSGKEWANKIISELESMPNVITRNRSQIYKKFEPDVIFVTCSTSTAQLFFKS